MADEDEKKDDVIDETPPEKKELTPDEIKAKEEAHLQKARESQEKVGPETKRFKEVYWKMKQLEDREKEREADFEAIRQHNRDLETKITELGREKKTVEPAPDPETDPQGYKRWAELELTRKEDEFQKRQVQDRLMNQIAIMSEIHEDYDAVIKLAEREYFKDPELKKKVFSSGNPPSEAYKLGKKLMTEQKKAEDDERKREENNEKGEVFPPNTPPSKKSEEDNGELTSAEKRVARMLLTNIPPEEAYKKYAEQKKFIAARSK